MSKEVLQNIIDDFSVDKFQLFFRRKSNKFRFPNEPIYEESENFTDGLKVAEAKFEDGKLIVCAFLSKQDLSERSGKKSQYEIGKKILRHTDTDAGIFIFYDAQGSFRFSLIYANYLGRRRDFSNFRRFTYFVSKELTNKTFLQRIGGGDFSTLEKIKDAFSVEPVTKQFYNELQNWYFWAMDEVEFPDDEDKDRENRNAKSLIRLITRIIFVWFMKEKGLVPATLFDKRFLDKILNYKDKTGSTYYKAILQNLFFATLNTPMKKDNSKSRIFVDEAKKFIYKSDAYMQQGYYRYKRFIKDINLFLEQFKDIPFLNGGLFDCLDKRAGKKEIRIDCFSDNPRNETRLKVPDKLFFLEDEIDVDLQKHFKPDLKKKITKKVKGLLPILKSYNFTIDENTPVDEEVALDPELLGRVFENLLASYNPETATTARKATGSYYTPREIVEYMVDKSLIAYLKAALSNDTEEFENKLHSLFDYSTEENPFDEEITQKIIDSIENIKILDPACGSGAFPMGILRKLVLALHKLDKDNIYWKKRLLEKVPPEIRKETRISLENKPLDYIHKLGLIEHCIYGIDIQEIAIQISKLRFFISLLVEQKPDDAKPNRDIKPLPNLETRFVAANTLISLDKPQQMFFKSPEVERLEKELFIKTRRELFYANSRWGKIKLQEKEANLRQQLKEALSKSEFPNKLAEQIVQWNPFDQNAHADWFDPEWMFGVTDGFDVVIANPPYIRQEKIKPIKPLLQAQQYKVFNSTSDLYVYFYEKGYQLLKRNGVLCFISSNKWMRAKYGEKLRKFFKEKTEVINLVDFGGYPVFEATVDTNIILFKKKSPSKTHKVKFVNVKNKLCGKDLISFLEKNHGDISQEKLDDDCWTLADERILKLKEKIEKIGIPLKEWKVRIYRGLLTGFNEAFIITTEKRNEILANCATEEERKRTKGIIKPILRGRDIERYCYKWAELWVIATFPALHLNIDDYPAVKKYLLSFGEEKLEQSGRTLPDGTKARKKTTNKWFETQDTIAYYPEFEKEKIVWQEIVREPSFAYEKGKFYCEATSFLMTGNNLKYLIAVLNSKPATFFFKQFYAGGGLGEEGYRYKKVFLEQLPVPPITEQNQHIAEELENLVDKILSLTQPACASACAVGAAGRYLHADRSDDYLQNPQKPAYAEASAGRQAKVKQYERQIDQLVYKLYGLTEEEIKIVEGEI